MTYWASPSEIIGNPVIPVASSDSILMNVSSVSFKYERVLCILAAVLQVYLPDKRHRAVDVFCEVHSLIGDLLCVRDFHRTDY